MRGASKWYKTLALHGNKIKYGFWQNLVSSKENSAGNFERAAESVCYPEYLDHRITVNEGWLKCTDQEELDETICHEMLHIVTAPLWDLGNKIIGELPSQKKAIYEDWFTTENEKAISKLTEIITRLERGKNDTSTR